MFSYREKRGILYLLILILVVILCVDMIKRRSMESQMFQDKSVEIVDTKTSADSISLFEFDPNVVTLKELNQLGLSKQVAVSIIRWRSAGKIFRIKEDLFECYNLDDSTYFALEPYIKIGDEYQYHRSHEASTSPYKESFSRRATPKYLPLAEFMIDTVTAEYLSSTGVLSFRQAEVVIEWHKNSPMYEMNDLRRCYVVSEEAASQLEQYVVFPLRIKAPIQLVDINKADSAELRSVRGIGEKSVVEIISYREKLGGFYSADQLSELKVVTESNFEQIITQISCDSCDISKIDINFALAKNLIGHPYISQVALRRLLKIRQIKGGWSSIAEMTEDNIFNKEEAARLRPYLRFENYTDLRK